VKIPQKLQLNYLLALDNHIDAQGIENKKETMKKIFEKTKEIADLGFGEDDIHSITKDEVLYNTYEKWREEKRL